MNAKYAPLIKAANDAEAKSRASAVVDQSDKGKPPSYFQEKALKLSSVDEVAKSLDSKGVKNNLAEAGKKGKVDLKTAQEIHASVDHSLSDYGSKFQEKVTAINVGQPHEGKNSAGVEATYNHTTRAITVNETYAKDGENFQREISNGHALEDGKRWSACADIKSVVDHEIGHAMTENLGSSLTKATGGQFMDTKTSTALSQYASTNKSEFHAELFSAGRNGQISDAKFQGYFNAMDAVIRGK